MSRRIVYELKEFSSSNITNDFQDFGSPIQNPCVVATFINTTDIDVYITLDGINNDIRLTTGSTLIFDTTNVIDHADNSIFLMRVNTQMQLKQENILAPAVRGDVIAHILTVTSR